VAILPFDSRGVLVADLARGRIDLRGEGRVVALPAGWLERISPQLAPDAGHALAEALEPSVRGALTDVGGASPEEIAHALTVAFAMHGLGAVSLESWGDAAVIVWRDPPSTQPGFRVLAEATMAHLISRISDVGVSAAVIGHDATHLRLLLSSRAACDAARAASNGHGISAALDALQPAAGPS